MTTKKLPPDGSVFDYAYLWSHEAERGLEHSKSRVCCLAFTSTSASGATFLIIIPVSDQRGNEHAAAIEIPVREKTLAGLDPRRPAYLHVDEYNVDRLGGSWYLEPNLHVHGQLSNRFMRHVIEMLVNRMKNRKSRRIDRI